jgi:dUTP pyrophosphatase
MLKWLKDFFKKEKGPSEIPPREQMLGRELAEARLTAETMSRQLQTAEEELFSLRAANQRLINSNKEAESRSLLAPSSHQDISITDLSHVKRYLDKDGRIEEEDLKPYTDMNTDVNIKYEKANNALPPTKFLKGDAGYDLFVPAGTSMEVLGMRRAVIDTGIKVEIPEGYYGRIVPRSSIALREGVMIMNEVIDSNYSDTIKIVIANVTQDEGVYIKPGMRLASLVIEKCNTVTWERAEEIKPRAKNLLGSTGE